MSDSIRREDPTARRYNEQNTRKFRVGTGNYMASTDGWMAQVWERVDGSVFVFNASNRTCVCACASQEAAQTIADALNAQDEHYGA